MARFWATREKESSGSHAGSQRAEFRKKNSDLGRVLRAWKVARNQKRKSSGAGSVDSKDTASQGPWRKKAESEAGTPGIQWV